MALTQEQEAILAAIADREIELKALRAAEATAQAELIEAQVRFYAERETAELALNEAMAAINLKYAEELLQKTQAVEDVKTAIVAEDTKVEVVAEEAKISITNAQMLENSSGIVEEV